MSKGRLDEQTGKPGHLFAYPGGRVCNLNPDIEATVAEAGVLGACTGVTGTNGYDTKPCLLRRTEIEVNDGTYVFKRATMGALDIFTTLEHARRFLQE